MSMRSAIAITAGALAVVTACSSSSKSGAPAGGGSSSSSGGQTSASPVASIASSGGVLTGPHGHTLYFNTVDTATKISCTGVCASEWPPLTGSAALGSGLDAGKFGTATRPDGGKQVTFDGHPLYEFSQDMAAGDKKGDGFADQGGTWHVASVSGAAPATGPSSAPPSSSSGGYNY
ncbi:MAG: hypothetical protein JWO57_1765 [Pseudonocardiales bacterium]|nr:hypothetical protein [Pseudonocardiales bacterium]